MGLISAGISLVSNALGIAKPFIDRNLAQQYSNENKERLEDWHDAVATVDAGDRARAMFKLVDELCIVGAEPTAGLSGNFSIPLSHLNALVILASRGIQAEQCLNAANYALREHN